RARWLMGGALDFLGRVDDQVQVRGHRVEPAEVETVLGRHPAVSEVAVVARQDVSGGIRLIAYWSRSLIPVGPADAAVLRAWAAERLPAPMLPSAFVEVDTLPVTTSGKVDRMALLAHEWRPEPGAGYAAPTTEVEWSLAEAWAQVLGVERVGVNDNFFDL